MRLCLLAILAAVMVAPAELATAAERQAILRSGAVIKPTTSGGDWPTYRADTARSGYTAQSIRAPLAVRWIVQERHAPRPAWPNSTRMTYDRAYQPVVVGDRLFYGTSADGRVVALDAANGAQRWAFQTDAPVRFAPAVWQQRVFVASDDGWLHCLNASDGRVVWRHRGGPRAEMLLGNDRMISRWPARGGPVVAEGVVYFAAGIWPSEGIFIYALDAETGKQLWCNDTAGGLELDQPHPGARAKSGVSAQGHLVVSGDMLLVPTGRAVPAALDRHTGRFCYFRLQEGKSEGGSEVVAIDQWHYNGGTAFETATGETGPVFGKAISKSSTDRAQDMNMPPVPVAAHARWLISCSQDRMLAFDRQNLFVLKDGVDRKGKKIKVKTPARPAWETELPVPAVASLVVAGDSIVAGAEDCVLIVDARSNQVVWKQAVQGTAYGLAVAGGRLYVSTDKGFLYCLAPGKSPRSVRALMAQAPMPASDPVLTAAAREILEKSGVCEGYCLDLGCGEGGLSLELARQSSLQICAVDPDPDKVRRARQKLLAAGLYGVRVTVHQADLADVPYPDYFADLIVSARGIEEGAAAVPRSSLTRMQRPYGGRVCIGRPASMEIVTRGALAGAGVWTHQYADSANTLCSNDRLPRSPLTMLWFRDTDLVMPSRHGRGPAPLVAEGRMFVEGLKAVRAVNIYNGRTLWEQPLPQSLLAYHQDHLTGVAGTGSNICLGGNRVFVRGETSCLSFDQTTGQQVAEWRAPRGPEGSESPWGYLAYRDGLLFGSLANSGHLVKESWRSFLGKLDMTGMLTESRMLFALDADTGQLRWKFVPRHSVRHNAIAVGPGRLYLIDRPLASGDGPATGSARPEAQPTGRLLCLDADSGRVLWTVDEQVFGTLLVLSEQHDVLWMGYQSTRFKLDSEKGGRMAAFAASSGKRLWDIEESYISRPVIIDRAIYAEPGKWDLLTGESLPFEFKRSYGCGILAGSERLLVYRSATLGYYDLQGACETENYGGIRPGCWINAIPAGGLVLLADAASWCTCSYLNQATIALQPPRP